MSFRKFYDSNLEVLPQEKSLVHELYVHELMKFLI